jgi:DNA-binding XRE family transcriptional regulator
MNKRRQSIPNNVRALREEILMSKAELARKAGVSALTVDRIENGNDCRLDTKRKIILALGKKLEQKAEVFPDLGDPKPVDRIAKDHGLEDQEEG